MYLYLGPEQSVILAVIGCKIDYTLVDLYDGK